MDPTHDYRMSFENTDFGDLVVDKKWNILTKKNHLLFTALYPEDKTMIDETGYIVFCRNDSIRHDEYHEEYLGYYILISSFVGDKRVDCDVYRTPEGGVNQWYINLYVNDSKVVSQLKVQEDLPTYVLSHTFGNKINRKVMYMAISEMAVQKN